MKIYAERYYDGSFCKYSLVIINSNQKMHSTYHSIPKHKADSFDLLKIFQFIAENNAVTIATTNLPKNKDLTSVKNYPDINLFLGV
jgi:hypothetical protein